MIDSTLSTRPAEPATPEPGLTGEFVQPVRSDATSGLTFLLAGLGDRHGLFQALVDRPATSTELAERTQLDERYLRERLAALAAAGYLTYAWPASASPCPTLSDNLNDGPNPPTSSSTTTFNNLSPMGQVYYAVSPLTACPRRSTRVVRAWAASA